MNYSQLLEVIAVSVAMTVALMLLMSRIRQLMARGWQRYRLPRHLKPCGVRRRAPVTETRSDTHEPS